MSLHPNRLGDLAYTLGARRKHLSRRGFLVKANAVSPNVGAIKSSIASRAPDLTYVFTGQGAQWAGMGRELMGFKSFCDDIRSLDIVLQSLRKPPSWSLEGNQRRQISRVLRNLLTEFYNSRTCRCQYRADKYASARSDFVLCIADCVSKSPCEVGSQALNGCRPFEW